MSGRARRWRSTIGQNPEYSPLLGLILLYLTDNALHPRRFSTAGLEQNVKDSAVIAIIATAQAIPVLSGGPDLSVGTVMTLPPVLRQIWSMDPWPINGSFGVTLRDR